MGFNRKSTAEQVTHRTIGAVEHEEIGEAGEGDRQVGLRPV